MSREQFDEGQVGRAYAAVFDCLECVEQHFRPCVELLGNRPRSEPLRLAPEKMAVLAEGLGRMQVAYDAARRLLAPMEKELPALSGEVVRSGSLKASSWAEAVMFHAERYVRDMDDWKRFAKLPAERKWQLYDVVAGNMPDVPEFKARLKIEEALLRKRARAESAAVRHVYEFQNLKPQSRRLFRFLSENPGRRIGYEEIAEAVMGATPASDGRVQTAIYRLRAELESMGSKDLAEAIEPEEGAYRFCK